MVVTLRPKPTPVVDSAHVQEELIHKENTSERAKETVLIVKEQVKEQIEILKTKAPKLVNELGGTYEERMKQDRAIHLTMNANSRPIVVLIGYWDGRLIQGAMNAIAKQYRQRRITATKM
jgi:hypothetical protein